jgi:hypothetical protein
MELETLKQSWESLDKKIHQATTFNQKLLNSIFSSRVTSTIDKLKRMYNSFYIVLGVEIIFLVGVVAGNPFDFKYKVQYLPYVLLLAGVILAFVNLVKLNLTIGRLAPRMPIEEYLRGIIGAYNKNKRFEKWFGITLLCVGLTVPFSFLPAKIARFGLAGALIDISIMISITAALYFIAHKLGAFKNPFKEKLENDLKEWEELQRLAREME